MRNFSAIGQEWEYIANTNGFATTGTIQHRDEMFHEKQLHCPASHTTLELSQSLAASLFSHQCRRGGTGYHSYSTILKIVLNTRSFPGTIFPRFCVVEKGGEGAQKRTESGGQAP